MNATTTVFITGATSGIGLATASYLAEQGFKVYGTYRKSSNLTDLDRAIEKSNGLIEKILMDVTDPTAVQNAVKQILAQKKIDVVINNAGYAITGTVESCTLEEHKKIFDTNYFGVVNVVKAVLPHFRQEKKGQFITIGSIVGLAPFPAIEIYSATKFALEGLMESMAVSLKPFHIKVSIVEPGGVQTPAASINQPIGTEDLGEDNPYENFHKVGHEMCVTNLAKGRHPLEVAQFIHQIIIDPEPKLRYPFGEAVALAEGRFKDPSGSEAVEKQFHKLTQFGLLPN